VSHLGFVVLGIFALTAESLQGAMLVMVSHGVSLGALFLLAGMLEDRTGTASVDGFGGLARAMPLFSVLLVVASLSTIGLPGTNGFVGEFLVLLGAFRRFPGLTIIATVGVILAAVYLLRALQRMLFETPAPTGRCRAACGPTARACATSTAASSSCSAPSPSRSSGSASRRRRAAAHGGPCAAPRVAGAARRRLRFGEPVNAQLTLALLPDLVVGVGALLLLLWAAGKRDDDPAASRTAALFAVGTCAPRSRRWAGSPAAAPRISSPGLADRRRPVPVGGRRGDPRRHGAVRAARG
jgi:NADH:ubiquinone oxidoreductase subunit 5 (subunit L)/multisubunit Na+/H+ antiporter MnhA subunit